MPISVKAEIFPLLVPWHTLPSKTGWYVAILDPDICVSGCWLWSSKQGSMYLTILLWMLITAQRHYWGGCWPCHRLFHIIHVLWWFRDAPCYLLIVGGHPHWYIVLQFYQICKLITCLCFPQHKKFEISSQAQEIWLMNKLSSYAI